MNIKCCGKKIKGLLAWDDAQLTDHAYNLYVCEKCGVIYKEDVWNDKGLRAVYLDGSIRTSSPDTEWEESGLLKGLDSVLKHIVLDHLKLAELKYDNDERFSITIFGLLRSTLQRLYEQPDRDRLLEMFDIDELEQRNRDMYASGKVDEMAKGCVNYIDAECEATAMVRDQYVSDLLEKVA